MRRWTLSAFALFITAVGVVACSSILGLDEFLDGQSATDTTLGTGGASSTATLGGGGAHSTTSANGGGGATAAGGAGGTGGGGGVGCPAGEVLVANLTSPSVIGVHAGELFVGLWSGVISKTKADGSTGWTLTPAIQVFDSGPSALGFEGAYGFVGNGNFGKIQRFKTNPINPADFAPTTLVDGTSLPPGHRLAVDSQSVYWAGSSTVMSAPILGGAPQVLATGQAPTAVASDSDFVYFTDNADVRRVPLTGGSSVAIASGNGSAFGLVLAGTTLYWTAATSGEVFKVPSSGGVPTLVASGQGWPTEILADQDSVYWRNFDDQNIAKVSLGGGLPSAVACFNGSDSVQFALGDTHVFWVDGAKGTLNRAPK